MATQASDLQFGRSSEWKNKSTLEKHFGTALRPMGYYDTFDYTNDNNTIYVELKTRRIASTAYPTSIIGENKVDACIAQDTEYWFAYCYTDGVYVIKYEKELFDTFQRINEYKRGERPDCSNNPKRVVLIPNNLLTIV